MQLDCRQENFLLFILSGCNVGLFNYARNEFLAGLAGMNVARELLMWGRIQECHIARVPTSGRRDTLKRGKNSYNGRALRGSSGYQRLI